MHNALAVHIAQSVGQQSYRRQNLVQWHAGNSPEIRTIDELLAVKSDSVLAVKFEHTHDMRMHQANLGLPFAPQSIVNLRAAGCLAALADLEGDERSCKPILREPQLCLTATAQSAIQCVSVG